ncbi:MAG: sensor histidine kinase, partial [Ignavibacteria bacterium]
VDTIKKRSEGLIHFVDDYRSLTSIPEPVFQIFLIKDLFERIKKLMENDLKVNNIKLIISVEPEKLELTADSELIEQVLINLIVNSIYFLKGANNPQIKLAGQIDERGKTAIKVSDNGPGISEDLQDKIFIPFFSTKKGGSGIGLSLSRQIMRSHGGSIHISSKPFLETIFTLKF